MKEITLSQGQVALVDDEDYEWLTQWRWNAQWNPCTRSFYAQRTVYVGKVDGKYKCISFKMHREILGLKHGDKRRADHKEPGETLNNQRSNLRIATLSQNQWNTKLRRTNTSGFKCVRFHKQIKKWTSQITINREQIHLGSFSTPEEAHRAYIEASIKYRGEFGRTA